jgi:hypothetical protein
MTSCRAPRFYLFEGLVEPAVTESSQGPLLIAAPPTFIAPTDNGLSALADEIDDAPAAEKYGEDCTIAMVVRRAELRRSTNGWTSSRAATAADVVHASMATFNKHFIQQFFDPMTAYTGRAKYILGEFGIGFALVVAVSAAYFWTRRAETTRCRCVMEAEN